MVVQVHDLMLKSFNQHLKELSQSSWLKNLVQKAVILDTVCIVRWFLRSSNCWRFLYGTNKIFSP